MGFRWKYFECSLCQRQYSPDEVSYNCPYDGGNLTVMLDFAELRQHVSPVSITASTETSLWRYQPLLPVADPGAKATALHRVGWTPVYRPSMLCEKYGMNQLWVKDESLNPTASFKDRASALVVAHARQINAEVIVAASTGNAGAALAGMAAAMGSKAVILAPKSAPPAKIAQLLVFGARVMLVEGNYDQAFELSIAATQAFGWYNRNTGFNPFTAEGKKTAAYEIWEQVLLSLPNPKTRLTVFIPVGDGNIISGIHKGFKDLLAMGWLETMPRLMGVQSEKSSAIVDAYLRGDENIVPVQSATIADSISVNLPRDGVRALRAVRETDGMYIAIADEEIYPAIAELGCVGIFAEPAGAAAYAGMLKALRRGDVSPADPVLVLNTGSGLKDIKAAMCAVNSAPIIEPTLEALRKELNK